MYRDIQINTTKTKYINMTRVKTGGISRKNHKKILKANKGYYNSQSKLFKIANQENMKSLTYSYINRKKKKREIKKLWIKRINANIRTNFGLKYSLFIKNLKQKNIILNKKILSKLCNEEKHIIKNLIF